MQRDETDRRPGFGPTILNPSQLSSYRKAFMPTVHDATYAVLRSLAMTTIFGNPGSNETPFS